MEIMSEQRVLFYEQFVTPILKLIKQTTIRRDKENNYEVGKFITFSFWKNETECIDFARGKITKIQRIMMVLSISGELTIFVDGRRLNFGDRLELVSKEGFEDWISFYHYFFDKVQVAENHTYHAKLIHWELGALKTEPALPAKEDDMLIFKTRKPTDEDGDVDYVGKCEIPVNREMTQANCLAVLENIFLGLIDQLDEMGFDITTIDFSVKTLD